MPRNSSAWAGSEALWITAAGFASAAVDIFGNAVVATRDLLVSSEEVRNFPLNKPEGYTSPTKSKYPFLPVVVKTLLKDVLLYKSKPQSWPFESKLSNQLKFVWEQHDMFSGIGYKVAKQYKVPYMVYVHGPVVWESRKWGVKRPLWGKLLEKRESDNLKKADIVACVSREVADQLQRMGVGKSKIKVIPMLVDTNLFTAKEPDRLLTKQYNLENKFVIGWTGSFRSFHGLDKVVKAFKGISDINQNAVLMLVGDGQLKTEIKNLVVALSLESKVVFTGSQKFTDIPNFLSVFDIALVSANASKGFHYSPLKLREYLACKKATIVPKAGDLPQQFINEEEVLFYDVDTDGGLFNAIYKLIEDNDLRKKLENRGYQKVIQSGTWSSELKKVIQEFEVKD